VSGPGGCGVRVSSGRTLRLTGRCGTNHSRRPQLLRPVSPPPRPRTGPGPRLPAQPVPGASGLRNAGSRHPQCGGFPGRAGVRTAVGQLPRRSDRVPRRHLRRLGQCPGRHVPGRLPERRARGPCRGRHGRGRYGRIPGKGRCPEPRDPRRCRRPLAHHRDRCRACLVCGPRHGDPRHGDPRPGDPRHGDPRRRGADLHPRVGRGNGRSGREAPRSGLGRWRARRP
jgi:hypothetical protein